MVLSLLTPMLCIQVVSHLHEARIDSSEGPDQIMHYGWLDSAELPTRLGEIARAMNQYDKKKMDTSDHVAACTLAGVKKGTFLITTNSRGHWMAILARGPTPEGSIATNLWELALAIPARIQSFKDRTLMTNVMMTMVNPSKQKII